MPGNLSNAVDQLSVISFGADQIRSVVQDKKILGISIKTDTGGEAKIEMAGLSEDELLQWREENNAIKSNESVEEIINNTKIVAEKISQEIGIRNRVAVKIVKEINFSKISCLLIEKENRDVTNKHEIPTSILLDFIADRIFNILIDF